MKKSNSLKKGLEKIASAVTSANKTPKASKKTAFDVDKTLKYPEAMTPRQKRLLNEYHQRRDKSRFA